MTSRQLWDKLKQRGFSDPACQSTLESVTLLGLVDDRRAAEMMFQKYLRKACSRSVIRQKLIQSGLSRELVDEQLATLEPEAELGNARKQMARLIGRQPIKAMASLRRRGFSGSQARTVLGEVSDREPEWHPQEE
jgi:SOS response regulatory protein OraA/RecX